MATELSNWMALGLILLVVAQGALLLSRRAQLKRRLHLPLLTAMGLLVVGFAYSRSPAAALILAPLMALWIAYRMRMILFCEICGATTKRRFLSEHTPHCHKCGSEL